MTVHDYNQFGGFILPITVPPFTEAISTMYPIDLTGTVGLKPYFSAGFVLKKAVFSGRISAAGTGVGLVISIYNRVIAVDHRVFLLTSPVSDDAQDIYLETSTIQTDGMNIFGPQTDMIPQISIVGDTLTFSGGSIILYGEFY